MKKKTTSISLLQVCLVTATIILVFISIFSLNINEKPLVVSTKTSGFLQLPIPEVTYVPDPDLDKTREESTIFEESGTTKYLERDSSIEYWHPSDVDFDYFTKINLDVSPTTILKNQVVSIEINMLDLFQRTSFLFNIDQVVFYYSDGKILIPYWVQEDSKNDALIWMKMLNCIQM